jgi:hypothetical protein
MNYLQTLISPDENSDSSSSSNEKTQTSKALRDVALEVAKDARRRMKRRARNVTFADVPNTYDDSSENQMEELDFTSINPAVTNAPHIGSNAAFNNNNNNNNVGSTGEEPLTKTGNHVGFKDLSIYLILSQFRN